MNDRNQEDASYVRGHRIGLSALLCCVGKCIDGLTGCDDRIGGYLGRVCW